MTTRALAGALVTLLLTAGPAAAQAKPTPCTGMAATDAAGDQVYHVPAIQQPTAQQAPTASDLTGAFFTTTPDGAVRANLVVSDLDTDYPDPATGVRYSIYYRAGGKGYYLRLVLRGEEPTWTYGTDEDDTLTELGKTKGELHKGKDGVVSFVVPRTAGGAPGTAWTEIWSATSTLVPQSSSSSDYLPDGSAEADGPRFTYTGAKCPEGETAPPPPGGDTTPPPDGGTAPAPGGGGGGGGTTPPSGGSGPAVQPSEAIRLQISAKPTRLRAKKVKRRVVFALTSNEDLTNISAQFKKGRKAMGRGKLAKLPKKGRLTVKVKRKLKKGRYTLFLTGRRPNGDTGRVSIKITVK